ncbi:MAG: DNA polymerase-3 subunit chi [Oceanospirillaceae bacterium]|jgi:DNA polymerase-3 subunit chi
MKKADFYILAGTDIDARQHFLGKLLQRILSADHQVYLYCADQYSAEKTSELLWQFQPTSFLANKLVTDEIDAPITIGWPQNHQAPHRDVIVNLSEHTPLGADTFERIAEIVIQQPQALENSRTRYKEYRKNGFQIQHNDMRPRTQN